jgi:hypothetical protein
MFGVPTPPYREDMAHRGTVVGVRVASALLAIGLIGACGGGGGSDKAASDPTTSTTEDHAALTAALAAHTLTPQDLATGDSLDVGWSEGDVTQGVDIQLPDCVLEKADSTAEASSTAKLVTNSDLHLPAVEQGVAQYSDGGAEKAFADAAARLDSCKPTFVFQGTPVEGTTERLPLTEAGDQSAAWRTTVTIAGAAVSVTTIHVQDGDLEVSLLHTDIGTPDPAALNDLVAKALAKLG